MTVKKLNSNVNDSIFKAMFRGLDDNNENKELNWDIKKDFLEFYKKYCNKESQLQPDDIRSFNLLEKKIFSDYHNDAAYLTKDNRLIVLFEHQSTYNPNMPSRFFNYYNMLLNRFWEDINANLNGNQKFEPPAPELYVIEVFGAKENKRSNPILESSTYSIFIDPMFDPNGLVNRSLIRFDATVVHFNTEEVYNQYLKGRKPEDLIHEFSLYYSMFSHKFDDLLFNDKEFQAGIFSKIFQRMGESELVNATIDIAKDQDIDEIYADFMYMLLKEREKTEQAEKEKEREQREKEREQKEKEKFRNILIEVFGTDNLDEIKKLQETISFKRSDE